MEPLKPGVIAQRLLSLREHTGPRVALRRGNSVATEHYAYPYLAPLWADHGWAARPLLRLGALAAITTDVADDREVRLGTFLRRLALADVDGSATNDERERALHRVGRRLVWAQTGDVEKLHMVLRQLMPQHGLAHPAVSWVDVVATYLWWDKPHAEDRRRHRRWLLEWFYRPERAVQSSSSEYANPSVAAATAVAPSE